MERGDSFRRAADVLGSPETAGARATGAIADLAVTALDGGGCGDVAANFSPRRAGGRNTQRRAMVSDGTLLLRWVLAYDDTAIVDNALSVEELIEAANHPDGGADLVLRRLDSSTIAAAL